MLTRLVPNMELATDIIGGAAIEYFLNSFSYQKNTI